MSAGSGPLELIGEARAALGHVKESLLSPTPEALENATPQLVEVVERLRRLRKHLEAEEPQGSVAEKESKRHIRSLAVELGRDLNDVRKLTEQAGGFYLGWASVLLSASGSYTPNGEAAPPPESHSLSVEG